jgi:hypothetical protein
LAIPVAVPLVHTQAVQSVAWAPDGLRIATAADRIAVVWEANTSFDELLEQARHRVFHTLNEDERRMLMLPELALIGRAPQRAALSRDAG